MCEEAKIQNPIVLKIDKDGNVFMINEDNNSSISIQNGVMLGTIHYGFIIISENNGKQREIVYPTIRSIDAIGVTNHGINIYEYDVRESWEFDKKGNMVREMPDNPIMMDYPITDKAYEHSNELLGVHRTSNPITIVLDSYEKFVLFDNGERYPLNPGVIIGSRDHYGFILIRTINGKQIERVFPTQNPIEAIGVTSQLIDTDFDIFEEGKHFSWKFDKKGKLIREAAYLDASRKDKKYIDNQIKKYMIIKKN